MYICNQVNIYVVKFDTSTNTYIFICNSTNVIFFLSGRRRDTEIVQKSPSAQLSGEKAYVSHLAAFSKPVWPLLLYLWNLKMLQRQS